MLSPMQPLSEDMVHWEYNFLNIENCLIKSILAFFHLKENSSETASKQILTFKDAFFQFLII